VRLEPWIGSQPFTSDPFGYKMMAFIAPYGFEKSKLRSTSPLLTTTKARKACPGRYKKTL